MVSPSDIRAAAERLAGIAHHTPVECSETFSREAGCEVFLKFENLQKTGSFKIRGAYNKMQTLSEEERRRGVIAPSAGNHAQAVAWAARSAGIPATVIMPSDASFAKVAATQSYGAEVRLVGGSVEECMALAREESHGKTLLHPFDDEAVIAGQGTLGLELLADVPDFDTVVVPVGGGGLISGIALAVKAERPDVRVVGVEVAGWSPYIDAAGGPGNGGGRAAQTLTIADGIAVKRPGDVTLPLVRELVDELVTVSDGEIGQTIVKLLERAKSVVEGAGAVSLAALLTGRVRARRAVALLSGGNIDTPLLMQVIRFGLTTAGRYLVLRTRVVDRPGQLMRLLQIVADARVNILVVAHHREGVDVSVAETGIELTLETRDEAHANEVVELVASQGYPVERVL